ncbi:MAG: hypothetical protein RIQ56_551 [Candidatus Parcubacteria bacterium]|jgi:hypothetical protein
MADKTLTHGGAIMVLAVLLLTAAVVFVFSRIDKNWWKHYIALALCVLIFEVFTSPMWVNNHLGAYGYIYQDISWVLTLGWTSLMLSIVLIVDYVWGALAAWKRFLMYLFGMMIFGTVAELMVMNLGLRTYAPEIQQAIWGILIDGVPIEVLYYIPVFSALVLGLYKYAALVIDDRPVLHARTGWLRRLILSFIAVFLFELMIEPMVINQNFPSWSYIYRDISIILTSGWVALTWLSIFIVEKLWATFPLREKFLLTIGTIGILSLPFESYLIKAGYRVYEGTSAGNAFSGIPTPFLDIPHEVALAIPLYFALVLGFIAIWDIMLVNPLESKKSENS